MTKSIEDTLKLILEKLIKLEESIIKNSEEIKYLAQNLEKQSTAKDDSTSVITEAINNNCIKLLENPKETEIEAIVNQSTSQNVHSEFENHQLYTDESETVNSLHQNSTISNTVENSKRELKNRKQENKTKSYNLIDVEQTAKYKLWRKKVSKITVEKPIVDQLVKISISEAENTDEDSFDDVPLEQRLKIKCDKCGKMGHIKNKCEKFKIFNKHNKRNI